MSHSLKSALETSRRLHSYRVEVSSVENSVRVRSAPVHSLRLCARRADLSLLEAFGQQRIQQPKWMGDSTWFDYAYDTPGQQESIRRDVNMREANLKLYVNSARIIHDGTFSPWTALACCAVVQAALVALIIFSRAADPTLSGPSSGNGARRPFRGSALHLDIMCTILSCVGPLLRLHYNGSGELVSAMFLSSVAVLFGLVGHCTASTGRPIVWSDFFMSNSPTHSGFALDRSLWLLLGALFFYEQARIFVMHIHDIGADIAGEKRTAGRWQYASTPSVFECWTSMDMRPGVLSCALPVIIVTFRVLVAETTPVTGSSADTSKALPDTSSTGHEEMTCIA
ncbi:hypothetical protein OPT61_g3717 [Boeremia exigua]|uniref:Uncharacterized protein n=1 Tax=Boeremia exigua TaxID=749465 RepID=A0ACC2IGW0_9PLEO|nr:hypothetical protein OPT61_g3717 [Boeremia exigua]